MDQLQTAAVDQPRTDRRHVPRSQFGQAVVQHRAVRIARGDDLGPRDAKGSLGGSQAHGLGFFQRRVERDMNVCRTAAVKTVAMRAVHMQIRAAASVQIG